MKKAIWKRKEKDRSLASKVTTMSVTGALIIGLTGLIVGIYIYSGTMIKSCIEDSFQIADTATEIMKDTVDLESIADEVMRICQGMTDTECDGTGSDIYYERFSEVTGKREYQILYDCLMDFKKHNDVDDVYYAIFDRNTGFLVYIADTDSENVRKIGDKRNVAEKEFNVFLNASAEGIPYFITIGGKQTFVCTVGVMIGHNNEDTAPYILVDFSLADLAYRMVAFIIEFIVVITAVTFFLSYIISWLMNREIAEPVTEITRAAQDYVKDQKAGENRTDHFSSLNIHTGDEVEELNLVMAQMENDLSKYMEDVAKATAREERARTEMDMAARIQKGALPDSFPAYPDRKEFDIYASMEPARDVGGDFYDFFLIDEDHLCMVIADVSDKGVPAALFMMASKIVLASNAMMHKSPAQIMTDANDTLCANNKFMMFVTVWLGILEISTGKLTAANAGHEYPAVMHGDGGFEILKDEHDLFLGEIPGIEFGEYDLILERGDKIFVYTDGLPEANDPDESMFGLDRMSDALNAVKDSSPELILGSVRRTVDDFVRGAKQFDDLTMLCLEYRGMEERL